MFSLKSTLHPAAVCLFLIFSSGLSGQETGSPGYIVTNGHDTLDVNIISFGKDFCRYDDGDKIYEKRPGEIYGFRFSDGRLYVSKTVELAGEEKTVFLEYLLYGIASLYYIKYNGPDYYYIEKDGKLHELTNEENKIIVDGKDVLHQTNRYKGILISLFYDCPQIIPQINQVTLSRRSMVNITRKYHNLVCDDFDCYVYAKDFNKRSVYVGPLVLGGYSSFTMKEVATSLAQIKYLNNFSGASVYRNGLGANVEVDMGTKKVNTFFSFHSYIARENYSLSGTQSIFGLERMHTIEQTPLIWSNSLTYNIGPRKRKLNPSIGAGYSIDFFFPKTGEYELYNIAENEPVLLEASDNYFLASVYSIVFTGGLSLKLGENSGLRTDFTLRRSSVFTQLDFVDVMSGWGGMLSASYIYKIRIRR